MGNSKVELLAPVGSYECVRAAVFAGCNAIYLGIGKHNARVRAENITQDQLKSVVLFCHARNVKVYLAMNTLIKDNEMIDVLEILKKAYLDGIDAVIIQDLGLHKYIKENFPELEIHASTQLSIHNLNGVKVLTKFGFSRVVLAREMSIEEINFIAKNTETELEVFVHGALCVCYSGQCLFSSMIGQRSGNRGMCAQPCRQYYKLIDDKKEVLDEGYLLSMKDLNAIEHLEELDVASYKIEGRMKGPSYVAGVVDAYRRAIDDIEFDKNDINKRLSQLFSRGEFTDGYLLNRKTVNMTSRNNPGHQGIYLGNVRGNERNKIKIHLKESLHLKDVLEIREKSDVIRVTVSQIEKRGQLIKSANKDETVLVGYLNREVKREAFVYKIQDSLLIDDIEKEIMTKDVNIPISASFNAKISNKASLTIANSNLSVLIESKEPIEKAIKRPTTKDDVIKQLKKTGNTPYEMIKIDIDIDNNIFIAQSEINRMRREAVSKLIDMSQISARNVYNEVRLKNYDKSLNKKVKSYSLMIEKPKNEDYTSIDFFENVIVPIWFDYQYTDSEKIIYALPHVEYSNSSYGIKDRILKLLENGFSKFMIRNIGQLAYFDKDDVQLFVDHTLNIYNTDAYHSPMLCNVSNICLSIEMNIDQIKQLVKDRSTACVIYGSPKLMTTKCDITNGIDKNKKLYLYDDRKDRAFRLVRDELMKVTHIYGEDKIYLQNQIEELEEAGINDFRFEMIDESVLEIEEIIKCFVSKERPKGHITYGHFFRGV